MTIPTDLIWIVDDSPTQAAVIGRAFDGVYEIESFSDGATMLERLGTTRRQPDVILIDCVMPGLSGDEVCRFVRTNATTADIPIVLLTGSQTDSSDVVRAFECGASDYVAKPFVTEELRARVASLVRTSSLKRAVGRDARRVRMIGRLGRSLLEAGTDVHALVVTFAETLVAGLCDGCAISLPALQENVSRRRGSHPTLPVPMIPLPDGIHEFGGTAEASIALPQASAYIARVGIRGAIATTLVARGIAEGQVIVTRDGDSDPFEQSDLTAIVASVQLVGLAIESAVRAEAERSALRFQQQMVGIVSHDLRTPLGAIGMAVDLLRSDFEHHPHAIRTLDRLGRSASRMGDIVERLLDVTRARLGEGISISREPVDLMEVAGDVLDELRLAHPAFQFELTGDPTHGDWDPQRLAQVMSNLASNAVQYGRAGAPVEVKISSSLAAVSIEVSNQLQASPIAHTKLVTLFDPFKRGDTNEHKIGLGLGLYIVKEIVAAHGGTVTAASDDHRTVFRVDLPVPHH